MINYIMYFWKWQAGEKTYRDIQNIVFQVIWYNDDSFKVIGKVKLLVVGMDIYAKRLLKIKYVCIKYLFCG